MGFSFMFTNDKTEQTERVDLPNKAQTAIKTWYAKKKSVC